MPEYRLANDSPVKGLTLQGSLKVAEAKAADLELSIIISVYNCLDYTRQCLLSLHATIPEYLRYEIIVIDDCSTDGTREYLESLEKPLFQVYYNKEKGSYAKNNNLGSLLASGKVLVFLNNDTVLLSGWLEPMLELLRTKPEAGCVGNLHWNPAKGLIDHAGIAFTQEGETFHRFKERKRLPRHDYQEVNAVSGACMAVPRELFYALGGFDEAYLNGSEDVDLSIRIRLQGRKIYVSHLSQIKHYVSSSEGRFAHDQTNRLRLRQKWEPYMLDFARKEWASAYLSRYAREFWKMRPSLAFRALRQVFWNGQSQ